MTETHPSYGLITVSRVTGRKRLFRSPVESYDFYEIRIHSARVYKNSLGEERVTACNGLPPVVLQLSAMQFLDLLTSMNHSQGVPCTFLYLNGQPVEKAPEPEEVGDDILRGAEAIGLLPAKAVAEAVENLQKVSEALTEVTPAKLRRALVSLVDGAANGLLSLRSNAQFKKSQLQEKLTALLYATRAEMVASVIGFKERLGESVIQHKLGEQLGGNWLPAQAPSLEGHPDCPHDEPLHDHPDGCPACDYAETEPEDESI